MVSSVGTSDFDAHMSGIKILKADDILRPVDKKTINGCFHFGLFSSQKVHTEPTSIRSIGVSKNLSFQTDFQNVHMTLVKSAPKKKFRPKSFQLIK
jgi:hypothetical protein